MSNDLRDLLLEVVGDATKPDLQVRASSLLAVGCETSRANAKRYEWLRGAKNEDALNIASELIGGGKQLDEFVDSIIELEGVERE